MNSLSACRFSENGFQHLAGATGKEAMLLFEKELLLKIGP
jgi:hypothetical protein